MNITEDYVSYEVAKLLKEKGFDEKTLSYYEDNVLCHGDWFEWNRSPLGHVATPTHQMAMKWLREVYDIFIDIGYDDLDWYWLIESISNDVPYEDRPKLLKNGTACHKTYEEAVEAALKYSLENLI